MRPNGNLVIRHDDGAACTDPNATATTQATIITFSCPLDSAGKAVAGVFGEPSYQYTNNDCVHYLRWETSYACPVQSFQGQDCEVGVETCGVCCRLLETVNLGRMLRLPCRLLPSQVPAPVIDSPQLCLCLCR